jgi:crotonobetainyl-CoA:carnitine CoA-transferase CaiB-like acyl-CoA transferase
MEPMRGIRIIDATAHASGPMATMMLADQGADVIRWETLSGDASRHVGGVRGGLTAYTSYLNRNKRSMAVDLKNETLRPHLYALMKTTDVFVQNSRPGALERCGFGFEDLHRINPRLIYVSISGFGATGPGAAQRVYDPVVQCVSGFATAQTTAGVPSLVKTVVCDKVTAVTDAQAIAAALFARERGAIGGHHVELSMLDANLSFLWPEIFWNHGFVGDEGVEPKPLITDLYRLLRTADGYATMIIIGDAEFNGACRACGLESLLNDPRFKTITDRFTHYSAMFAEFEEVALTLDSDSLLARLDKEDVPCSKVNTLDDVLIDPRTTHRQSVIEYDHPQGGRLRQARAPAIFNGQPCEVRLPSPKLGEHTSEILQSLGVTTEAVAELRRVGAIG